MSEIIYLGLGSNLGNRLSNLDKAEKELGFFVKILKRSPVYKTQPWGYVDQPYFLNTTLSAVTDLPPLNLLTEIKKIEEQMGRAKTFHYGPRLIDIDILFYGDLVFEHENLVIPHPHLHERAFVLVPLVSIAPDYIHPKIGQRVIDLLQKVDLEGVSLYNSSDGSEDG